MKKCLKFCFPFQHFFHLFRTIVLFLYESSAGFRMLSLKVLLPGVILQECLIFYVKKQADYIGRTILSKLLNDWRLLDELGVLRAIYLLGSGDLLQHFLSVIFNKLDKGESLDDDFDLNTILQFTHFKCERDEIDEVRVEWAECVQEHING